MILPVRVLIVDDQERTRRALEAMLTSIELHESGETQTAVQIVGQAADGREALESIRSLQPDVVLMDARMPRMDGLKATRLIKETWPNIRVILLTMFPIDPIAALGAGADAILLKGDNAAELEAAVLNRGQMGVSVAGNKESPSLLNRIKQSLAESAGDIVFGMEDGTVSIFGLVFGVAASSTTSAPVVLAGATGAIAAAVSMMAGVFLDVQTSTGIAKAALAHERQEIHDHPDEEKKEIRDRLAAQGFSPEDTNALMAIMERSPDAMLRFEEAFELKLGDTAERNPIVHATWMFLSDLVAAAIPVIPFALFPIETARTVSLLLTAGLLVLLGIGRARIAHTNLSLTVLETLGVAGIAAAAGVLIGKWVSG